MTGPAAHFAAVLASYQAVRRLPSIVACVLADGRPVWAGSSGASTTEDTQYRIGSITKVMTGVLVLQCRDDGLLGLDDPLGAFVPESGYRQLSLRQLLSHTSGMPSEPVGPWWERSPGVGFAELIAANTDTRTVFGPGRRYHYSNLGFALLGEVVSRVRGRPWAEVVKERLLVPLGLSRTSYLPMQPHAVGLSVDHLRGTLTAEPAQDTGAMAPAGQLWSTVGDLARFLQFLRTGAEGVLGLPALEEMRTPRLDGYGLAIQLTPYDGGRWVGHSGSMPGFQAGALIDPVTGAGVVAVTNATTGFDAMELAGRLVGSDTPRTLGPWVPTTVLPDWAEELLGHWYWGNSAFEVRWHNEHLEFIDLARWRLSEQFQWSGSSRDGCIVGIIGYHAGEVLRVVRRSGGAVSHLECASFIYTRTPYDPTVSIPGGHPEPDE